MLSFLTGIMQGLNQSRAYSTQARITRAQGQAAANQANAQASAIEASANRNQEIAGKRLRTLRENQRFSQDTARTAQVSSGFTDQGTGGSPERSARLEFDSIIENMAQSASIDYSNAWQNSIDTRRQGQLQQMAANAQAESYQRAAKNTKRQTVLSGFLGAVGSVAGYINGMDTANDYNEANAARINAGEMKAQDPYASGLFQASGYASTIFDASQSLNPYTASMSRKNPWSSFLSILQGSSPGFQKGQLPGT